MKTLYNNYGLSAKEAALERNNPVASWKTAVERNFKTDSAKIKGCPKNTFLGLCEVGLVKGIPKGNYTRSAKNKKYAIEAIKILKVTPTVSKKELWNQVRVKLDLGTKSHNSQMDVVLALWENELIEK